MTIREEQISPTSQKACKDEWHVDRSMMAVQYLEHAWLAAGTQLYFVCSPDHAYVSLHSAPSSFVPYQQSASMPNVGAHVTGVDTAWQLLNNLFLVADLIFCFHQVAFQCGKTCVKSRVASQQDCFTGTTLWIHGAVDAIGPTIQMFRW